MILPGNLEKTLPVVEYDEIAGLIKITGKCVSPEVEKYFSDFLPYLKDCVSKNPMDMMVIMDLEYFSTRASKVIMDMFNILKKELYDKKIFRVKVKWLYGCGDLDMLESGEDYSSLTHFDFEFIEKDEE